MPVLGPMVELPVVADFTNQLLVLALGVYPSMAMLCFAIN